MSENFSGELWDGITDIYAAILAHPFLAGMTDGSLPAGRLHVSTSCRTRCTCAGTHRRWLRVATHAPDPAQTEMFARHAAGIVAVEMSLH